MPYGLLADLVVAVHVGYVAFVLLGQLLIVVAAPFKWQWARNPWFRFAHLTAIGIVAVEALMQWTCPLTTWEYRLRELAGQQFDQGATFMGRLLHDLLFYPNVPELVFTVGYIAAFLIVLQGLVMYPPRGFRLRRPEPVAVGCG